MATLTSANSALSLAVVGLFNSPQPIQGYSTDDMFSTETVQPIQTEMGADGRLSAGYTPVPRVLSVVLQADSLSNDFFDTWDGAQQSARESFICNGSILIPSIGRKFALTRGFLTGFQAMPSAGKILRPRTFQITFESIIGAPA